ncbi:salicylate hydroxylase [Agrocybe pediades]|nr:salicylate hydroxylase [Agrocybe pediades]
MEDLSKPLRVAIVGAGIGGLSLSAGLGFLAKHRNLHIDIYEAASSVWEIGAGINVWPRTWDVFKALGLEESLLGLLPRVPSKSTQIFFHVRKSDQKEGVHIVDLTTEGTATRFHRAQLQQAILSRKAGQLHLSHRLVSYEESESEVKLKFSNGHEATYDLLVAMDGINSVVRKIFLAKQWGPSPSLHPVWSGDTVYRALIPTERLDTVYPGHRAKDVPLMYIGKSKHIIVYPVAKDKLVNCVFFTKDLSKEGTIYEGPPSSACTKEELLSNFAGWEEEVQALIHSGHNLTKWIVRSLVPLQQYSHGRVILAGDAAHAMTPHQGMGAGQAVEDAYIISSLIADSTCTSETIPLLAQIYDTVRRPVGNTALEKSRLCGILCQLLGPRFEDVREGDADVPMEKLQELFKQFREELEWVWRDSAEVERLRALEMLQQMG